MPDLIREQVQRNYTAFQQKLPELITAHRGKFALMRDGEVIDFFDTARDAFVAGQRIYAQDKLFSVQEVIDTSVDLGFYSHALPQRSV